MPPMIIEVRTVINSIYQHNTDPIGSHRIGANWRILLIHYKLIMINNKMVIINYT